MNTPAIAQPAGAIIDALTADQVVRHTLLIQEIASKVMKEGEHFGTIPGCGPKPTLFKAGAEKLLFTFRLAAELDVQQTDFEHGHREYRVNARIVTAAGQFVAMGVGTGSTMEKKYRYRSANRRCPECGKECIIKGKADFGGGWLCFGKKGGCGAKWPDGAQEIEGQEAGQGENPDLADCYNTILKMAKKRAVVDGTITACAASDFFAQDLEDLERKVDAEEAKQQATKPAEPTQQPENKKEPMRPMGAVPAAAPTLAKSEQPAPKELTAAGSRFDKTQCEALFYELCGEKSSLGVRAKPLMTAVWASCQNWDQRGQMLTDLVAWVAHILKILGDGRGGELVDWHVEQAQEHLAKIKGNKAAVADLVAEFCKRIAAAATGDVTAHPVATEVDPDGPPF